MAATTTTRMVVKEMLHLSSLLRVGVLYRPLPSSRYGNGTALQLQHSRPAIAIRCASSDSNSGNKVSSRLSQVQQLLQEAEHRALSADTGPTPKITLDHVTVNFARSGGPGGQNVNKVNTKVDMRFNVKNAYWLSERVREKIMQMLGLYCTSSLEKNRINKDGELVISSTKTRTQKGNIEDALAKLQEIIDAASYVPPPPSEEQKKKIAKMAAIGEQKRLKSKKTQKHNPPRLDTYTLDEWLNITKNSQHSLTVKPACWKDLKSGL